MPQARQKDRWRQEQMILAGDIGGTSTRLACYEIHNDRLQPMLYERFRSQEHAGLEEILTKFQAAHHFQIETAAFGIAGAVRRGRVETTNLPWVVDVTVLA